MNVINNFLITMLKAFFSLYLLGTSHFLIAANEAETDAAQAVTELHDTLISLMQNAKTVSVEERYQQMQTAVENNFNTPLIARVILGRYWKSLDESQRQEFIELFKRLTIATYVDRFDSFDNHVFNQLGSENRINDCR